MTLGTVVTQKIREAYEEATSNSATFDKKAELRNTQSEIDTLQNQVQFIENQINRLAKRVEVTQSAGEAKEIGVSLNRIQADLATAREEFKQCTDHDEKEMHGMRVKSLEAAQKALMSDFNRLSKEVSTSKVKSAGGQDQLEGLLQDIANLRLELADVNWNIERAKQRLYFPDAEGFRFRQGSNGVYVGARDFTIQKLIAGFEVVAAGDKNGSKISIVVGSDT